MTWAGDALDEVRRQVWNDARRAGQREVARGLKGLARLGVPVADIRVREALPDHPEHKVRIYAAVAHQLTKRPRRAGQHGC